MNKVRKLKYVFTRNPRKLTWAAAAMEDEEEEEETEDRRERKHGLERGGEKWRIWEQGLIELNREIGRIEVRKVVDTAIFFAVNYGVVVSGTFACPFQLVVRLWSAGRGAISFFFLI